MRRRGRRAPIRCWARLFLLAACLAPAGAKAEPVNANGRRLARALDRLNVEERWLPRTAIDWRTGEPDPNGRTLTGHCSAFAAGAGASLGIYLLRPPEHSEWLLANAQCAWLQEEGPRHGWTRIDDGAQAQGLANRGNLVLACYKNRERDDPGHIAIVRPRNKSLKRLEAEGPDVTQAGSRNYRRTSAKVGFRLHARAWNRGEIVYYWHPIAWGARAERWSP